MANQNPIPTYFNPEIGPNYQGLSFEDLANSFNNGQQFSNQIQQQQQKGILARLIAQNTGADGQVDLNKSLQSIQTNPNQSYQPEMVNTLSGMIQQQNALRLKAQQDAETHKANTFKTTTDAQDKEFGTIQNKLNNVRQIWQMASKSGNANDVLQGLNSAKALGAISPEVYTENVNALSTMKPEDVMRFASGLALSGEKDQAKYLFETPDNVLDNRTSSENNAATVKATMRGQDITAGTAQAKLAEDKRQSDKPKFVKTVTAPNGAVYGIYSDGSADLMHDGQGSILTEQTKKEGPKLSDKALGQVAEYNTQLKQADQNWLKIGNLVNDIKQGKLNLNAGNQISAKAKNFIGMSDANSRGIENFNTVLNQAINDVLIMAKGTQTEGDAKRAAQVIAANPPRDNAAALQVLNRLAGLQRNIKEALNQNVDNIYGNYGIQRPQTNLGQKPSTPSSQGSSMSATEVQQVAQKMGISVQDAIKLVKSKGINIQ